MIPLLINQSNISRDFSLRFSKPLADSDLADCNRANTENIFYIVLTDLII